jgi:PTS system N-acetylglucosamine-specific IIC component
VYFALYYGLFRFFIRWFNLKTPGREDAMETLDKGVGDGVAIAGVPQAAGAMATASSQDTVAQRFIVALGGAANLQSVDACTTRLRLTVADSRLVSEPALKALGSHGMLRPGLHSVQVVLGPKADIVADQIRAALAEMPKGVDKAVVSAKPVDHVVSSPVPIATAPLFLSDNAVDQWLEALGGAGNLKSIEAVASTRLRVRVQDAARVMATRISALGGQGVMPVSADVIHVVIGPDAMRYAEALSGAAHL